MKGLICIIVLWNEVLGNKALQHYFYPVVMLILFIIFGVVFGTVIKIRENIKEQNNK